MGERLRNVNLARTSAVEPIKTISIQTAHCPQGCDLMTDKVKIHNLNSICVKIKWQDREGLLYIDPQFGSYQHVSEIKVPDGEIVEFFCPYCSASLRDETQLCHSCSAPLFTMVLPNVGEISGCLRKGCFEHTLKIESFESMQLQIDDKFVKVIM